MVLRAAGLTDAALRLGEHGAEWHSTAARGLLGELNKIAAAVAGDRAGVRLHAVPGLAALAVGDTPIRRIAANAIGRAARPVRAVLFDKSAVTNWALAWHQDRTICVAERIDVPGFGPWTVKQGLPHVAPPVELLARMVTLRVHLDDVPPTNPPLLFAPGSHRMGLVREENVASVVAQCGARPCLAVSGDVWIYSTLILHASKAAERPARRRVLQIDYAAENLPGGLRWAGL